MTAPEDDQIQTGSPTGSLPPPGPVGPIDFAEPPIVGDRLGVPAGAARSVLDPHLPRPGYPFLFIVSAFALASDVGSKLWAEKRLEPYPGLIELVPNHLQLVLARNKGGAGQPKVIGLGNPDAPPVAGARVGQQLIVD